MIFYFFTKDRTNKRCKASIATVYVDITVFNLDFNRFFNLIRCSGIEIRNFNITNIFINGCIDLQITEKVNGFVSVELSMGQMIEDVKLYTGCKKPVGLCNRCGGMIPSPDEVLESIRKAQKGEC